MDERAQNLNEELVNQALSNPYQAPIHNLGNSIIYLTNPENTILKLENNLKGMVVDNNGNSRQIGRRLLNDMGVRSIISHTEGLSNAITELSNYDPKFINPLMMDWLDRLIKDLGANWYIYGMNPQTRNVDRSQVLGMARNVAHATVLRAQNEGERRFWKNSVQTIETKNIGQERKGLFQKLTGWKGQQ
jgi:hypothetical protein